MALSKRFGQIQHIAVRYEEKRSEEHEILRKLIGKTSLFKYSTPLDICEDRDLREITENDSEEETDNPEWKVEFQAILRRSKHKKKSNDTQDFELDPKTKQTNHTNQAIMSRDQYTLDQVLKDKSTDSSINEGQGSEVPSLLKAGTVPTFGEGDSNYTDSDKIPLIKQFKEDVMNIIYETVVEDKIENGLVDDTNISINKETGCTTNVDTDTDKFRLTSNIKQPCQKRSKQKHACYQHDDRQKENMVKKVHTSKTKEINVQKNVLKVIPAFSFPLDELLPLDKDHPNKLGAPHNERYTGHISNTRNSNASDNSQTKPTVTEFQDSIFHGEVYNSPNYDSEPTLGRSIPATGDVYQSLIDKHSSDQVSEYLGNEVPMASNNPCKDKSLDNFSFIMDALHNGNSSFVEHLQNAISRQIRCNVSPPVERFEDKSKELAIAGQLNCPSHAGYGFYNELNSDAEASCKKNRIVFDKDEEDHKRNEHFVSEKGDNLDKQSKELFKLFIQQCSQLVRTDQDKKMLQSLVQLLKRESGTDLGMTGLTPPPVKHKTDEESSPTESIHSANVHADKDIELFEGRTLLKGFVQPRHIPKTTTVKSGRDKPTDPRPISTLLAKTSPKPLPLPQFVHDLRDDKVIQRILTLDWDSKRVLFPDVALYPDVNERDGSPNLYNPSTDLKKSSNLKNMQTVTKHTGLQSDLDIEFNSLKQEDRHADIEFNSPKLENRHTDMNVSCETPVKDEQNKSVKGKSHQLYVKVYGEVKGGMDESSADITGDLAAQNTNNLAFTCSKSAKKDLSCDFSKAAEDDILKGRSMSHLFTTSEQQQEPQSNDKNETDAISASVIDSVDKLGSLLDKTYGTKSFLCQNIFESNTDFTSETLHDPKKHMKNKKTDNTLREPGEAGKIFHSEKHQNKTEQSSLEIPTHVSPLTEQTSRKTYGTHDSNNKNLIMLKDAQDNLSRTCMTHLQVSSKESKTTKPCVGIVKPMQVIVISDEDESSNFSTESQKDSARAKVTTRITGLPAKQGNATIGPSITATDVELEEMGDYENNQCKRWDNIIEMNDGINSMHRNSDGKHRKRKHLPISVAQDYEEGQLISDSGSELDIKRKKSENKPESVRRVPHVTKRHYRERRRHSSSSSAESLNLVNLSERSEAKERYKPSRNSSTAERKVTKRTFDTIKKEPSKNSRKRHHTVHEGQQFSIGQVHSRDTKETKRRYSEDSKVLPKGKQVNVNQNTQNAAKSSYYQSILSPEYSSLSDEMLSEEYHQLFGKGSIPQVSDHKLVSESTATKSNFTSAPVQVSSSKSMQEDKAFLQQYKKKVQRKEALGLKCEIKMEKTLCIEQELEDRKFLQNCKKKQEEKAKLSDKV